LEYASQDKAYQLCKNINNAETALLNKINNLPPATKWIPESDVYRLIMRSNKAEAEKFQDWVVEKVLPTIRKTGGYSTQPKPLSPAEMLLAQAQLSLALENRIGANEAKVEQVAARVDQISVDLRNGVPHGFLSRKNARTLYAKGLSQAIFEEAMMALNVTKQSYVSYSDGHSTVTFAYQESHIPTAISHFIRDLEQKTPCQCFSKVLNKRVNYVKIPNYGLKDLSKTKG
jgi:prophage antirepressor-like protein